MQKEITDIKGEQFAKELALNLEKMPEFKMPEWAYFVKTSVSKSRPPTQSEWWYLRAASVLRQVYLNKVVGVERLRTKYGSNKDRGMRPKKFYKGSGKIIRTILQQAEKAGFVKKIKDKKAGRMFTPKGKEFMLSIIK